MKTILLIHLLHIFIIGGLFLYVGIYKTNISKGMYTFLLYLGIIIIFYHMYKTYNYFILGKNYWLYNLMHILIIGPLLIYVGLNKEKTPIQFFDFILMLGFASIGYHGYYTIKNM